MENINEKLVFVQSKLKAPKNQKNNFGGYMYRSCEDILQAARPLCNEVGLALLLKDEIVLIGDRYYVKSTARVMDASKDQSIETVAYARECESKKGMDDSQLTGACSSYARKYALCGLFAIDDNKDADSMDNSPQPAQGQKSQNVKQNTKAQTKTPPAVNEKDLLGNLQAAMKENGLGNDEVKIMIQQHYGAEKWNDLKPEQKLELANKPLEIWDAVMKKLGGKTA